MSIQGVFNTGVTKQTSVWVAAGWVQATALIACAVVWFFYRKATGAGIVFCITGISAFRRSDGSRDHIYSNTQYAGVGTGPDSPSYCSSPDHYCIFDELLGLFGTEKMPFAWHKLFGAAVAVAGIFIFQRKC